MSLAVAYGMKKKMARGGMCSAHGKAGCEMCHGGEYAKGGEIHDMPMGERYPRSKRKLSQEDEGGDVEDHDEDHDLIERIMSQREAGPEANESEPEADFEPNEFDDMVKDDHLEDANYTGANSGDELGNEQEDEDRDDIISRIMRARRLKDRMPRPA